MMTHCQLDPSEQIAVNFNQNTLIFFDENLFEYSAKWWLFCLDLNVDISVGRKEMET